MAKPNLRGLAVIEHNQSLVMASHRVVSSDLEILHNAGSLLELKDMISDCHDRQDCRAVAIFSMALGKPLAMILLQKECQKLGFGLETLNDSQLVILIKDIEPLIDAMVGEKLSHQIINNLRSFILNGSMDRKY